MAESEIEIEDQDLTVDIDYKQRLVTIHHRYEWLHILNDALLALWFLIGSILFFNSDLVKIGTWFFVIGSLQMLMGPVIRIAHKIQLKHEEP